jgi:hypothetical protein
MPNLLNLEPETESATRKLGALGERLAAEFVQRKGFRLVAANFLVPVGRNRRNALINAEIDLIAYDGETLCFDEKNCIQLGFFVPYARSDFRSIRA